MSIEFRFPDVGEGIHEGKLVEWLVKEGDAIAMDQNFCKVETDKAIVELPSPYAGTVEKCHCSAGDTIKVGEVIITFSGDGESEGEIESPVPAEDTGPTEESASTEGPGAPESPAVPAPLSGPAKGNVLATPHTRSLARKLGVDITAVTPTGRAGRVTDEDVEKAAQGEPADPAPLATPAAPAVQAPAAAAPAPAPVFQGTPEDTSDGVIERVPATHLRKIIARHMVASKQTSAHVTHVDEADVTDLFALYKKAKNRIETEQSVRFTIFPFFIKALTTALRAHPILNASYDAENEEVLIKKFYNIGIAVDTPEGLMVPVIRNADRKDMVTLAREMADLADRARTRKIGLDELKGSTFTITNVGAMGGVFATPIINQPELAIMGLHAIKDRPGIVDGQVVPRKMMYLSLSFDHRVIDGIAAARFMTEIVDLVQNPDLLLMRLF